jgi:hypothetical protein
MVFCQQLGCEVVELNVQADHVHLLVKVPPKLSISGLMGVLKGRTAIRLFSAFPFMRKKPYWGNHFWAKGYWVDTVREFKTEVQLLNNQSSGRDAIASEPLDLQVKVAKNELHTSHPRRTVPDCHPLQSRT